jgi:hypothetical protein
VQQAAQTYWDASRSQLAELRDNGLISAEGHDAIVANNQFYSPREFISHIDPPATSQRGTTTLDSGIKELDTGSEKAMINDPFLLLQHVYARAQSRILKNKANNALRDFAANNPDNGIVRVLSQSTLLAIALTWRCQSGCPTSGTRSSPHCLGRLRPPFSG